MKTDLRFALVNLCRRILHPLVRSLVRYGVSAGELKAIVDSVYAHAGSEYLVAQGQRVTFSKLAVITGINRSFLPGILAGPKDAFRPRSNTQVHRASRVLQGWMEDAQFHGPDGSPATLPIRGKRKSFEQLTRAHSGGIYYRTLLSELLRTGAVKKVGSTHVRLLKHAPAVGSREIRALYEAGEIAGDLLQILDHNLAAEPKDRLPVKLTHRPAKAAPPPAPSGTRRKR